MTIAYSGTAGATGAIISITGSETLATLKTSLASNTAWAVVNGTSITFAATLSIGSGSTTGSFTGSDLVFIFPSAYTFTVPNNAAQSGSSTTLTDAGIIFDGSAKSNGNAINYGTHTWTRVVYRSQVTSGRTDLFQNVGCVFNFNNVQLTVSSTATAYPYDFIHQYNNTTVTVQGLTVTGAGGTGSANSLEIGAATGTTTTLQGLTIGGVIGVVTINNGGTSYSGTEDFRSLSWPNNTNWAINYGSGGGTMYVTNPNKPSGWTTYSFTGGAGGSGTLIERYSHDVTCVNSSNTGITGANVGDVRSSAFLWNTTTASGGAITTQYVTTTTLTGAGGATPVTYSTSVTVAAWLYGYVTFVGGRTFTPAGSGITDTLLLQTDITTLSATAVAALTSLATLDNLYDASRYWNTLNTTNINVPSLGTNIITYSGSQLNLGSYNLVINSGTTTAGNAFSVSGTTITIYASTLAAGTKFTSFTTTGTVTVNSGATVTVPYTGSAGQANSIVLTNIISGSTIVSDQGVATTSSGTSITFYTAPGASSTFHYAITKYGYLPVYGTTTIGTGSTASQSFTIVQSSDTGITQATQATVAAYTSLTTLDNVYDYWSYYLYTGAAGSGPTKYLTNVIAGTWSAVTAPLSKAGSVLTFYSSITTLIFSTATITGTVATSASSITIAGVATTLAPGATTYASLSAANVTTFTTTGITNTYPYVVNAGQACVVTLKNLISGSVIITDLGTGTASTASTSSGTSVNLYTAPGAAANLNYTVSQYGYLPVYGQLSVGTGASLSQSVDIAQSVDAGNTATKSTASGYTTGSLATLDNIYDYWSYYLYQTATGATQLFGYFKAGTWTATPLSKAGTAISVTSNITTLIFSTAAISGTTSSSSTSLTIAGVAATVNVGATTFSSLSAASVTTFTTSGITNQYAYTISSGTSGVITLNNLVSGSVIITDLGTSSTSSGTSITLYSGPGANATFHYAVTKYGYLPVYGTIAGTSGAVSATISQSADTGVTQATQATVAAYTSLATLDQIYDYWSYYLYATTTGATQYFGFLKASTWSGPALSKAGTAFQVLSTITTLTFSTATITGTTAVSGTSITICGVATTLNPGATTYASFSGSSITTFTASGITNQYPYIVNAGQANVVTLNNLQSASIVITDLGTSTASTATSSSGTSITVYTTPKASSTFNYAVSKYGYAPVFASLTVGTGSPLSQSVTVSQVADSGNTASQSTAAGYTTGSLATLDNVYDYWSNYINQTTTGATQQFTYRKAGTWSGQSLSRSGSAISVLSAITNLTLSTAAIAGTTASSATTIVIDGVASSLAVGAATFQTLSASSVTTFTLTGVTAQFVYTISSGTSLAVNLTVPSASSVIVLNGSGAAATGSYTASSGTSYAFYAAPGQTGTWTYRVAKYGSISASATFTPSGQVTAAISLSTDTGITQATQATVASYTQLTSFDQIYDYAAYNQTQNLTGGILVANPVTKNGSAISFGAVPLIFTTTGSPPFAYSGSAITINSGATLAKGVTFTSFATSSTTTLTGVTITGSYTNSTGTSTVLTLTNLPYTSANGGTYLSILNASSTQVQYIGPVTSGSQVVYIAPGPAATYTWKAACYGYISGSSTFATQGYPSATVSLLTDTGITQATASTVAGYTTLGTPDKLYDFAAYTQTQNGSSGITITNPIVKNGSQLSFGASAVTFNTTASPIFSATSGVVANTGSTFSTGITYINIATTSTLTLTGVTVTCVYATSAGTSTVLTISNLPYTSANGGSYISLINNSSTQVQYVGPVTSGTQVIYITPGAALSYSYKIACYGYISATTSFTTQGYVTGTASLSSDTGITQSTLATVAAYTSLSTCDQLYDYAAYWETTNNTNGITASTPIIKNANQANLGSNSLSMNLGPIATLGTITGGSSYTTGTYTGVSLTGGSGTGATANITVSSGAVTAVTLVSPGTGYAVGNTLSAAASTIGGTGSGFSIPVSTIAVYSYTGTAISIYAGSTFATGTTFTNFATTSTVSNPTTTITCVYATSSGTSTVLTISNLPYAAANGGSYVSLINNSSAQVQYVGPITSGSTTIYIPPTSAVSYSYKIACYGYLTTTTGFTTQGYVTGTASLTSDTGITQATRATVAAYTTITTCDQLYDYAAYWETTNNTNGITVANPITKNGTQANLGSNSITMNTSGAVYAYSGTAITINAGTTFATGTTFTSFGTSSTITNSSTTITCVYTNSSGTSTVLTLTNLPYSAANGGTYLSILNNSGTQLQYIGPVTSGTQIVYIAPTSSIVTYSWKAACYGYLSSTTSFSTQGYVSTGASLSTDSGITQTNRGTVSAYTALTTCDQLYDYLAYWQTTNNTGAILVANASSKNGTQVNFGSVTLTFNNSTTPLTPTVTSGVITAYTVGVGAGATFGTGVNFTSFATTSSITLNNSVVLTCVYTNSAGTSTVLILSNLPYTSANGGTYLSILNNGSQIQYVGPVTSGTQTIYIPPTSTSLTYSWKAACYGYLSATTSFSTQGYVNNSASLSSDTGITNTTRSSVAAYTALTTCDQLYDFLSYWQTTNATGAILVTNPVSKNGTQVNFGSVTLTFNNTTTTLTPTVTSGVITAYTIGTGSTAILATGSTFTSFATTSTTTLNNSVAITCVYTNSSGTSTVLTVSGLQYSSGKGGTYLSVANAAGTQQQYIGPVTTGTQVVYVAPSAPATWSVTCAAYGFLSYTGSVALQGYQTVIASLSTDTGITQGTLSTVSGYSSSLSSGFTTIDQIYDYLAYWQTTNNTGGITVARPSAKNGAQVSFGTDNVVFNATASALYAYTAGSPITLTFKSAAIAAGSTYNNFATSGTVTSSNGASISSVYTSNLGTSSIIEWTGLVAGTAVYIQNASAVSQLYLTGQSGTYIYGLPPGASAGTWQWGIKAIGYTSMAGTYVPSAGGSTIIISSQTQEVQATGAVMYTGTTNSICTVSFTTDSGYADILIGNGSATAQNVYDISENALITQPGMQWIAQGGGELTIFNAPSGNYLFMTHNWRLKALNTSSPNATVQAFALSTDGAPINNSNGSVTILTTTQPNDVATAVWNSVLTTYSTAGTTGAALTNVLSNTNLVPALL